MLLEKYVVDEIKDRKMINPKNDMVNYDLVLKVWYDILLQQYDERFDLVHYTIIFLIKIKKMTLRLLILLINLKMET
jgi:hypothetical protein